MRRPNQSLVHFLLFGFYLITLTWLVTATTFFKKLSVPAWVLALLFLIKVVAGLYYGWYFTHMPDYKVQADTWRMYYESLIETEWLRMDPTGFFSDLFRPRYQQASGGILATTHSYWNDIKSVLVVKLMALCNLLSGGRYYVNVLFFEYLSFFGPVALSRVFLYYFPPKKWYIVAGAFLFPSTLLWCSGFHKEGLLLTSLAMAVWLIHTVIIQKVRAISKIVFTLFHLLIVFLLRNYLALFFALWCIPWLLAYRLPAYKWNIFLTAATLYIVLFFSTSHIPALPNLPQKLAGRQHEFLKIPGESLVQPRPLQPGLSGYSNAFPQAMMNGFLQPLPWKIRKLSYLPAAAEIIVFFLLILNFFNTCQKNKVPGNKNFRSAYPSLLLFCTFFSATAFLLVGYTIPYLGAIVRYKAVIWPFLILPLLVFLPDLRISITKKNMK